jgi:hypothetical protein
MFKVNEASWDRIARVVLGVVFMYLWLGGVLSGALAITLAVLGAVFIVTGIVGFCPIYALLHVATKK